MAAVRRSCRRSGTADGRRTGSDSVPCGQEALEDAVGVVAVFQAGPGRGLPGPAPAGGGVAAAIKGLPQGLGQFRRAVRRDHAAGVQPEHVRDMAVLRFRLVVVLDPLLQARRSAC